MMKYKETATGQIVRWLAAASDLSEARTGKRTMAVYCPDDDGNTIFVMGLDEFYQRFEGVEG